VATDYANLHEAVAAAREHGVYRIYLPPGVYYLDKTLDLTRLTQEMLPGETEGDNVKVPRNKTLIFEGSGRSTVIVGRTGDDPAIDLSGSQPRMILRDFMLQTPFVYPDEQGGYHWKEGSAVGILMARVRNPRGGAPSSGGHYFENVRVSGNFPVACAVAWDSETNRFVHCAFQNRGRGDGFIFTNSNQEGVKSPYVRNGNSTNTEQRFYGTSFASSGDGGVGLRITGKGDVSVHGGYFSAKPTKKWGQPFAGVYLDGTRGISNVTIRDVRMECTNYSLYAVGAVNGVLIEGGEWIAMNAENIRHVERVPSGERPHRYVEDPNATGRARNWVIRGLRLSRSFEADPALALDKTERREAVSSIRFDALQDSRISNISYYVRRHAPGKAAWGGDIATDRPHVVVEHYCRRNYFEVPSRGAVSLPEDARGNEVVALCEGTGEQVPALWRSGEPDGDRLFKSYDGGIRRRYVKPDSGTAFLNLGVTNVLEVEEARRGDLALHDGTGFEDGRQRLAIYNGERWMFFELSEQEPSSP
jgi:hypothetical protein